MLMIRLLAVFFVLITNTWLLSPVQSDALSRYKRAIARRAESVYSRLAGEPCTVSGVWRSRRQPRSISPSQYRPPAARPRTHTSRRELYTVESAAAVCAGGCGFETEAHRVEEKGGWRDTDDVGLGARDRYVTLTKSLYEKRPASEPREPHYDSKGDSRLPGMSVRKDAGQSASFSGHAQSQRGSRDRFSRSLDGTFPYEKDENSSLEKVFHDTSTDSVGLRVLYKVQQGDGDHHSSTGTVEDGIEDYSGEVEEADPPASLPVGSPSPWGSPVSRVPPSWMTALYFSGRREQLKLKPAAGVELPRAMFSLELWVKPEGGQSNPAVIAGGC